MSSNDILFVGYPDGYGEASAERQRELRESLQDGITELRRINARAALQRAPRTSTSQIQAYARASNEAPTRSVRADARPWTGAFGSGPA